MKLRFSQRLISKMITSFYVSVAPLYGSLNKKSVLWLGMMALCVFLNAGCAHYPVNEPIKEPRLDKPYTAERLKAMGTSDSMILLLTFSGGGTRAAALSYGVLEELSRTEVVIDGTNRRLLDEVDVISSVSGGSFTAAYYGLFGDRIFQDFESKFLKKDVQGALTARTFFNRINWIRLSSPNFDRSDLAAEYYDEHIFANRTFADMDARKGPIIIMNATDMTQGVRVNFNQDTFDFICSDLSAFPVARAVAASSAVPLVLSPISLHNYAGSCSYKLPEQLVKTLKERRLSERQFYLANNIALFLDVKKKPYIHLVDGGVSDNLGLRAVLDRVILRGDFWETIKETPLKNVHKVIFVVVNAETEPDSKWDRMPGPPPFAAMLSSYSSVAIERYNEETVALLKESLKSWEDQVRTERCGGMILTEPNSCGDIQFYVIEVKFDKLEDEEERLYFKGLPTSFKLTSEEVDRLRGASHRILAESNEFQRLLLDLR